MQKKHIRKVNKKMILENKLNIADPVELAREEERISKKKAKEMFEVGFLID